MTQLASKRKLWFTISLLVIIPGLDLADFLGSEAGHRFHRWHALGGRFRPAGHRGRDRDRARATPASRHVIVQRSGPATDETFLIRMPEVTEGSARKSGARRRRLNGGRSVHRAANTRPSAARSQPRFATAPFSRSRIASVGILLYMAYAFRNTQSPLLYGSSALVAMLHDVLVVLGHLFDPGPALQRPDRRPLHHRAADRHRVQRPRHDRGVRPHPGEPGEASR